MWLYLISFLNFLIVIHSKAINYNTNYDKNVNIFSPSGELLQVEYAKKAGLQGNSVFCVQLGSKHMVVCALRSVEERILLDRRSIDKINRIDHNSFVCFAGLAGDGRALVQVARSYCINKFASFGTYPSVRYIALHVGETQHAASFDGGK